MAGSRATTPTIVLMIGVLLGVASGLWVISEMARSRDIAWTALVAASSGGATELLLPAEEIEVIRPMVRITDGPVEEWLVGFLDRQRTASRQIMVLVVFLMVSFVVFLGLIQFENREQRQQLRDARRVSKAITETTDREQHRIARELHDGVGQLLSLALLQAQSGARDTAKTIMRAIADLRLVVHNLSIDRDDPMDLRADLQQLADRFSRESGIRISVKCNGLEIVSSRARREIQRISQELITNGVRHSGAGRISLSMFPLGEQLLLRYTDDGVGMETLDHQKGHGLSNVRYRAEIVDGSVQIASARPLEIVVSIPPEDTAP